MKTPVKKYDDELVQEIHQSKETIKVNNTEICLKESPTRKGRGYLDPFELEIIEQTRKKERERPNPFEMKLSPEQQIAIIRNSMGFPNLNLNTREIITKYEDIDAAGHSVGLWRYYLRRGKPEPRSALIYFHGGGWFGGSVYAVENPCRLICELGDAVVFNVDYDLAPAVKFPVNIEECYDIVKHVYEHAEEYKIDKTKITVAGDSAGGNFAAAVSLKDRDEKNHYISQTILIYPGVTFGRYAADGYTWDVDEFEISEEQREVIIENMPYGQPADLEDSLEAYAYFENLADAASPYASPMLAESFSGLPKTMIITSEYDGLRPQGEFYGSQLAKDGVDTTIYRYCGCTHAFIDRFGFQPQSEEMCLTIAEAL